MTWTGTNVRKNQEGLPGPNCQVTQKSKRVGSGRVGPQRGENGKIAGERDQFGEEFLREQRRPLETGSFPGTERRVVKKLLDTKLRG